MKDKSRIHRLISLVKTEGTTCQHWFDNGTCSHCSGELSRCCRKEEGPGPYSVEEEKKARFDQARKELEEIPRERLFEMLI